MRSRLYCALSLLLFVFVVEVLAETGGLRGTTIGSYANTHRDPTATYGFHPLPALRGSSNRQNKRGRASQSTTKNDRRLSCELTSAGTFGNTSNKNLHFVSFYYQVEFVSGTTLLEVASELLPLLEESITEGILPSLFAGIFRKCSKLKTFFLWEKGLTRMLNFLNVPISRIFEIYKPIFPS